MTDPIDQHQTNKFMFPTRIKEKFTLERTRIDPDLGQNHTIKRISGKRMSDSVLNAPFGDDPELYHTL